MLMPANLPGKLRRGRLMYIHSGRGRRRGFGKENSGASEPGFTHVLKCERPGKQAPVLFGAAGYPFPLQDSVPGTRRTQIAEGSCRGGTK